MSKARQLADLLDASGDVDITGNLDVTGIVEVKSGGVDGTYQKIIDGYYSSNNNERNSILTSVSSNPSNSGFKFMASNGGGSSEQTDVAHIKRTGSVIQNHFYFHQRGHTETTASFSLSGGGWQTFMTINNIVVPSGYEGFFVLSASLANNYESNAGQFYWRFCLNNGSTDFTTNDMSNGRGVHDNYNPGSAYSQGITVSSGTYSLRLQTILARGIVTLTNWGGKNNLDYELWIRKI